MKRDKFFVVSFVRFLASIAHKTQSSVGKKMATGTFTHSS